MRMIHRPPTVRSAREGYATANSEAAGVILADPVAYPPGSLMQQWARAYMERSQPTVRGPLFAAAGRREAA
jgi:hypothetical protein